MSLHTTLLQAPEISEKLAGRDYTLLELFFKSCFEVAIVASLFAMILFMVALLSEKRNWTRRTAQVLLGVSGFAVMAYLGWRWYEFHVPPLISTFEVTIFFAGCLALLYLTLEYFYDMEMLGFPFALAVLGVLLGSTLLERAAKPDIMPALQNNFWLTIHVSICFVGYAAFAVAYVTSLLYLASRGGVSRSVSAFFVALTFIAPLFVIGFSLWDGLGGRFKALSDKIVDFLVFAGGDRGGINPAAIRDVLVLSSILLTTYVVSLFLLIFDDNLGVSERLSRVRSLNRISYKSVLAGFVFLGIGIITGSIWAEIAWGAYWSWDPKEVWALIAWMVYLAYLHLRLKRGWNDARLSWIIVGGFAAVMFTFFGVNFLLSGLHSYM